MSDNRCRAGAAPAERTMWQPERLPYNSPETLFAELDTYHYVTPHSAPINMAIDEALLEAVTIPSIRFYRWYSPALSFGYFGKFNDVADHAGERDLVRRWTGGGIVFHGEDLTYSIVIPTSDPVFAESPKSIYENVHRALAAALAETGKHAVVAAIRDRGGARSATATGVTAPGYNNCFANPVYADVMIDGRKVAGAAQRRTRRGLLHQGSIQYVDLENGFTKRFAQVLSANCSEREIDKGNLNRARETSPTPQPDIGPVLPLSELPRPIQDSLIDFALAAICR